MNFRNTAIQIRPCIVSMAIFALGLKNNMPLQYVRQRCFQAYWIMAIDTICFITAINNRIRSQAAIDRFDDLINN